MSQLRATLPSINSLATFEAAVRCGSFARAASELNVTGPAVSRMVGRLETTLGACLLVRTRDGVLPNENGRVLFDAITRGFGGIEAALREIADRRSGLETVTLSLSTGFTTHWLMPRMAAFRAAFPHVDLRFELIMGALSGPVNDVDLGMRFVSEPDPRHETTALMPELILPVRSPGCVLDDGARRALSGMMTERLHDPAGTNRDWHTVFLASHAASPTDTMIFSDYALVIQAALLGQGVALGWLNVISHWLRAGVLVPAGNLIRTGRICHLVRSRGRAMRPVITDVRDWMIRELQADIMHVRDHFPELGLLPTDVPVPR